MVGARVIATTSSKAKADRVKALGADHVILYTEDENWGETAKKIAGPRGIQHIIEVGGPNTMTQSLKAIGFDGVISVIGFLGGVKGEAALNLGRLDEHLHDPWGVRGQPGTVRGDEPGR
jgi:NADPH:quinone reductase-like Zn-dependent oxidoreductase